MDAWRRRQGATCPGSARPGGAARRGEVPSTAPPARPRARLVDPPRGDRQGAGVSAVGRRRGLRALRAAAACGKSSGTATPLKWLTRKNVVEMSAMRNARPLKRPVATPCSAAIARPVASAPAYLARARSPCMHVLIVSIGCVSTPASSAPASEPAASAALRSTPDASTSRAWMSGVTPSIDIVKSASRPIVIDAPRASARAPCSRTRRAGVASMVPPKRCCWIMMSSHTLHGTPDARPPRNAPPTCTWSGARPAPPRASSFWKTPVAPNCTAFVPPRLSIAIGRPRYTTRGLNEIGSPCCTVFFHDRNG